MRLQNLLGAVCAAITLCAANFLCTTVNAGVNFNCRRTCTNVGAACATGGTCIGFNPAFTVGGTQYGVCN